MGLSAPRSARGTADRHRCAHQQRVKIDMSQRSHRRRMARRLSWLVVLSLTAAALFAPAGASPALALTGAVYTSNFDGSIINENVNYPTKQDVYLTGGPCNGGSHLADGDYYYEVKSPNGTLLSSDAIGDRKFTVADGFIQSTTGHLTHAVNCDPAVTGITVQLFPYDDTPNPGGEYKLTVATAESVEDCDDFDADSSTFEICGQADQKSDNFKVGEEEHRPRPRPRPRPRRRRRRPRRRPRRPRHRHRPRPRPRPRHRPRHPVSSPSRPSGWSPAPRSAARGRSS